MLEKITELRKHYEQTIAKLKRDKISILGDIGKAIEESKSEEPTKIDKSKLIKKYWEIKEKYK